jgi:hypothetical protein
MTVPAQEPPAPAAPAAPTTGPAVPAVPPVGDPPATPPPAAGTPSEDKPLGPNGEKALQAEREARQELEKKLKALAPLEQLAAALGGGDAVQGKSEIEKLTERQAAFEKQVAEERAARFRAEIANEKGLTPQQAARLQGANREELAADADALVAAFGITPGAPAAPGTPKPDPSQGARPGGEPDIDQQIRAAESKGDVRESIRLKTLKSMQPAK